MGHSSAVVLRDQAGCQHNWVGQCSKEAGDGATSVGQGGEDALRRPFKEQKLQSELGVGGVGEAKVGPGERKA